MKLKKLYSFLTLLTAFLFLGSGTMWGASPFTVEGTSATNDWVPVYGYYADNFLHSQIIYPKGDLEEMDGKVIKSMTFHTTSSYTNVSWGAASFQIRLKLIDASTLSGFVDVSSDDPVFSGSLSVSDQQMVVTFTEDFIYDKSKNLLFDLQSTAKGSWSKVSFYGSTVTGASKAGYSSTSAAAVSSSSSGDNFRPKTTFAYAEPPTCPTPKLSMTGKEDTSASFSWTKGKAETQWQFAYKTGTTEPSDGDWCSPTTSTSTTISGLTASTEYTFYLRAYCDESDQSTPVSVNFTTDCEHIAIPSGGKTFDFETSEGFDSGSLPTCWNVLKNTSSNTTPATYAYSSGYNSTAQSLHFYGGGSSSYQNIVVLPKFATDIKNLKISFHYYNGSTGTGRPQFAVGYVTDPTDISTYTQLGSLLSKQASYTSTGEISLSSAPKGSYIAICHCGGSSNSSHGYVDNLKIASTQDCNTPQSVSNTAATGTTASFSWTAREGVPTYQYCVVARDAAADWSGNLTTNTNSCTAEGLTASTNYDFYVKCVCGGGVAGPVQFATGAACAVPSNVAFTNQVWNGATVTWDAGGDETAWNLRYKAGSGDWTTVEDLDATSYDMPTLTPGTTYTVQVEADCQAGWSDEATYAPVCPALGALSLSNEKYNGVTVSWSAVTGISSWTLKYRKGSDDWTVVDDIDEETYTISSGLVTNEEYTIELYSECGGDAASTTYTPEYGIPAVLTASPVKDVTATLNWSSVDGATGYQYSCVPAGDADAWSATQVANSASLSGLTAGIEYTAKVRAVFGGSNYSDPKEKVFSTSYQAPTSLVKGATTSNSLTFSWSKSAEGNADNRYQYVCKTGSAAPTADQWANDAVLLDEGVRSVTVEDLSIHTTYYFFVRSYYADGKYSSAINTFNTTDCGIESLEYSETFGTSSATKPGCWTIANWGTSANQWTTANDYSYTGYALRYNAKTSTANQAVAVSPTIYISEKCVLTYYVRNYYYYYSSYYIDGKVVITDGVTTQEATWGNNSSITAKTVDLSQFVGKNITISFQGKGAGTSMSTAYLWIDDVSLSYKSISAPTNLAAAPTADGAEVTWDATEGPYDLRYRVNGSSDAWTSVNSIADENYTIESLTADVEYEVQVRAHASANRISSWTSSQTFTPVSCPVSTSLEATEITHNSATISWSGDAKAIRYKKGSDDWSSETISPADESFDLSELVAESTYTVQVKADCEDGDNWSAELEFTTKCTPITITKVAPYEADFAGLTNEMPSCWDKSATTKPYVTGGELQFNGKDQTAILPKFSNATSTLMLKFNYKHSYSASYSGQIQVGYIDASGDFQTFGSALSGATSYTAAEINFDGVDDDEAKYIAIRLIHNNPSNISYADGFIKDVVVELAPTCYAPASIADAASITASGAMLSWTASGKGETQYQWAVAEGSAAPVWVDDAAHKVGTTSKAVSGLNANSDYTFYVRSYCAADDQSEAVSKAFTTKCAAIAAAEMPFEEAFSATLGACWKTYAASYYSIYVSSGELHATAPKTSGNESVLVLPAFEMALNQLVVSFDYKGSNGTVEVGYVTDPEDKTTFVAVGGSYTVASAYQQAVTAFVSLGAVTGNVALRFKGVGTDGSFTVDNLRVAYGTGIADNTDNSEALAGLLGQTVDFVVNRTFKRDFGGEPYFNTICLPFSLSAEELATSPLKGAELWTFKYASVVNDELQVRIQQESSLKAGRPYLILFEDDDDLVNPLFKNVTISAASGEHMSFENIAFIGTLAPVAFTADDQYRLFLAANNQLAWAKSDGNVRSFRAYFQITPPSSPSPIRRGMKARIVMKEEVTTGVEEVQGNNVQSTKLLENNQVIIIRNGVKYNLQGQAIK